ncbi:VOC family protein [Dyella sp. C11]|uniref:VOC family protein n=1 Tax=Dyella sp. C11 TaxID=2126991 RepID=UPI000D64C9C0|nr:VOC family protein [Dyella sp. C11]
MRLNTLLGGLVALAAMTTHATDAVPSNKQPIVQVRGIDHVGLNVPDMTAAVNFFSDTFGFSVVTEMKDPPVDAAWKERYHMHPDTKVRSIVMMRAGNGANIELFQYESRQAPTTQPYYDDPGTGHVAFYTDNMAASVAALRAAGVKLLNDPIDMKAGPTAGETWVYFLAPWGQKLELVSYEHQAYESNHPSVHLWKPASATNEGSETMLTVSFVENFADHYLQAFNEDDATKRASRIAEFFTQDTKFTDPEAVVTGIDGLNELMGHLHQRFPGWKLSREGDVKVVGHYARVPWKMGPADGTAMVRGEDVIEIRDGKVVSTVVFVLWMK